MGQHVNSYQLSLVLHLLVNKKERGETIAMIKDGTTLIGRGQTRGDAINSVLRRWLNTKDCDSFMERHKRHVQKYETKSWANDENLSLQHDVKILTVSLANESFYVPAYWCEYFNFTKLDNLTAKTTINLLTDAIEKLGTKFDTVEGNIGSACLLFKTIAENNPLSQWLVK